MGVVNGERMFRRRTQVPSPLREQANTLRRQLTRYTLYDVPHASTAVELYRRVYEVEMARDAAALDALAEDVAAFIANQRGLEQRPPDADPDQHDEREADE